MSFVDRMEEVSTAFCFICLILLGIGKGVLTPVLILENENNINACITLRFCRMDLSF